MFSSLVHPTAETVELLLCSVDGSGQEKVLCKSHFTYFLDQKPMTELLMTELLLRSVFDGENSLDLQSGLVPPLSSADALREYDRSLSEALAEAEIPEGWSLVGSTGREGRRISTVEGENM